MACNDGMDRCLPSEKSKNSLRVSASAQRKPFLVLNSTIKSKPSCATYLHSWPTGLTLTTCTCNNMLLQRFMPTNT